MNDPAVVIVHSEDGPFPGVEEAWTKRWPAAHYQLTTKASPFSYADVLRRLWAVQGRDLVIAEQDVCPPEHSPQSLLRCHQPWCTHPHWTGQSYQLDSLGLVKFSAGLRYNFPMLMDLVCSKPDVRYWVRRGWTRIDRACSVATLNGPGKRAAITHNADLLTDVSDPGRRPTTHDWMGLDTSISRALMAVGLVPCVHGPPTIHLHDYEARPKDNHMPWHQRPYDPAEWPQ